MQVSISVKDLHMCFVSFYEVCNVKMVRIGYETFMKLIGIVYDTFCKAVMKEFGTGNFYIKYFVFSGVIL